MKNYKSKTIFIILIFSVFLSGSAYSDEESTFLKTDLVNNALDGDQIASEKLAIDSIKLYGDTKEWTFWTQIAAENGSVEAQKRYSWMLMNKNKSYTQSSGTLSNDFLRAIFWACKATKSTDASKKILLQSGADAINLNFVFCADRHLFLNQQKNQQKKSKPIFFPQIVPSTDTTNIPYIQKDAALGSSYSAQSLANYYLSNKASSDALMNYWFSIQAQNGDSVGAYNYGLLLSQNDDCVSRRGRFWIKRSASHGLELAKEFLKSQRPPNNCLFATNMHDIFSTPHRPPAREGAFIDFPYYREAPLFIKNPDIDPFSL